MAVGRIGPARIGLSHLFDKAAVFPGELGARGRSAGKAYGPQKQRSRKNQEFPSMNETTDALGAHASSVPGVSNTLHGCVRSQEPAAENPWQLAKDFGLGIQMTPDLCSSVFICGFILCDFWGPAGARS